MRALILTLAFLLVPLDVAAQDPPTSQVVTHRGAVGQWFPEAAAVRLLADIAAFRSMRDRQIPALERSLQLAREATALTGINLRLTEQQASIWKASFERLARSVRPVRTAWYETPVFWFCMGVVGTGVLAVGLAFGLNWAERA